jgi:ABC-2 type transport system permease protein
MSRTLAIGRRHFLASFLSPNGWIVIGVFLLLSGLIFSESTLVTGEPASLRHVFRFGAWALLIVAPAITMGALSEEYRLGTFESLATSPVTEVEIVAGKFVASLGFVVVMLVPTLVYVIALEMHGRPDYGELACGYLGLLLVGATYLSAGLFVSTLTDSQVVAFLVTLFSWLTFAVGIQWLAISVLPEHAAILFAVDPTLRLHDFTIGLVDTANVVYFAAFTAVFLAAAVASLQLRRWR